ncbi:diguanylate cyclase [Candidatus Omnitrophota bacterium]
MEITCSIYQDILFNLFDGVYILDADRKIIYWNRGAERLTGYKAEEVIGKRCSENVLMHIDKDGVKLCLTDQCPAVRTVKSNGPFEEELYIHHKDGYRIPVLTRISPLRDRQGKVVGTVEIFSDNSSKVAAHEKIEELQKLALLDPLTELGNRRYIESNLHVRVNELKRYKWPFGVAFFDIDHFKKVNDTYGHDIGDKVLKIVAHTLSGNSRPFDIFGRWGGEEFVGIIVNVDENELFAISDRLRLLIEQSSLSVGEDIVRVTVSAGVTMAKASDTAEGLMKRADRLMYKSKSAGLNCVSIE